MALPQRLGKALALKDREREVRALRVSTPEAHDETEGLREKEAQGVELLLTAPLWEPELQREGQLEVLTEREGAPVRELAPLAVGAPADAQALAEKVRETLGLPLPLPVGSCPSVGQAASTATRECRWFAGSLRTEVLTCCLAGGWDAVFPGHGWGSPGPAQQNTAGVPVELPVQSGASANDIFGFET